MCSKTSTLIDLTGEDMNSVAEVNKENTDLLGQQHRKKLCSKLPSQTGITLVNLLGEEI